MDVDGKEIKSAVDKLMPGDVIILKPGEKVPIDGQVIKGNTMINESLLTGESIPVEKRLGYLVYAGTMNQNGILKIQVTKRESETVLSQIILTVEEAQASKAPIQQVADRVTGVFVPIIIMIALATFGVWYIFLQAGVFSESLEKMIAVLIVACPCALGLATPTSIMVGSGRAAQLGILFKEGKSLEALGKGKTVIFDKTGTITKGVPQVTNMYTFGISEEVFLKVVGAVEINLKHPLAQAVINEVKKKIRAFPTADDVLSISGYGVKASVNGRGVTIASPSYFSKNNGSIPLQADQLVTTLEREGKTVMIVFIDKQFAGVIAVADGLKDSSIVAISRLKQMGINVVMLTGDNRHSAKSIAKKVGISKFKAGVTPQDKANIIKQLQQNENSVIMVGDGMNDAPALAVANVGVAIGTGSDVAIESGDVTIIRGDLKRFVDAMMISKKTMRNIKQNLFWAFFYNILMIPLAMFGVVAPWLAGAAMAFSSVSVIFNALRLKRVKV